MAKNKQKKIKSNSSQFRVSLGSEEAKAFRRKCKQSNITPSTKIRWLIKEYVNAEEEE